jgi:N utilization substance protein B
MGSRTRARARALQVLYAWETRGGEEPLRAVDRELDGSDERPLGPAAQEYCNLLLDSLERELPRIDARIEALSDNWRLSRMSTVDRNILRLASAEMLFIDDVPLRVSLQEAIRLADWFSTEESRRFVNGVLDALLRQLEPEQLSDPR